MFELTDKIVNIKTFTGEQLLEHIECICGATGKFPLLEQLLEVGDKQNPPRMEVSLYPAYNRQ
ncbi:hypothetical protein GCM10008934_36840 [Virgibacillus salarius]